MVLFGRMCRRGWTGIVAGARRALRAWLWARPVAGTHAAGTGGDLWRSRRQLLAENVLLRQQLLVLRRGGSHPVVTPADRALLVLLAGRVRAWQQALLIVRPETLLRWHRAGFRSFWARKSRSGPGRPPLPAETVALIRRVATGNPLWGAERIRGELAKLDIRVAKRTIQAYLPCPRAPRPRGQAWATFLRNHAREIWACDFLPVTDLLFRPLHAFFIVALGTRRVMHVGVTRHPTDAQVTQQLREATPFDERPRFLVRDNDAKYGPHFDRRAASGIRVRRTPSAPRGRTLCASGSWAACGASAWTTCLSWVRRTCGACSARMSPTATTPDRIKGWARRAQGAWSPSRSWVACITTIVVPRNRASGLKEADR